jgi:hypothetical protein
MRFELCTLVIEDAMIPFSPFTNISYTKLQAPTLLLTSSSSVGDAIKLFLC